MVEPPFTSRAWRRAFLVVLVQELSPPELVEAELVAAALAEDPVEDPDPVAVAAAVAEADAEDPAEEPVLEVLPLLPVESEPPEYSAGPGMDTRVGRRVQRGAKGAIRAVRTATGDGDVDTEGVVLRAVLGPGSVHGDDLVAEDVATGGQGRGDSHGPGVIVGNQISTRPGLGVEVDAGLVDLDPLELGLVNSRAGVVAGATVGYVEVDSATRSDGSSRVGILGVLIADDVAGGVRVRRDEAIVGGLLVPTGNIRVATGVDLLVVIVQDVALLVDAIGGKSLDEAVGGGLGGESGSSEGDLGGQRRHLEGTVDK
ncbi:hypothetical protein VP1G_11422 [Cytospora mali]|uniref:Uncharacterized protein n=1 Tax=Cytospora mali TaxID=578113 RepID=A0A194VFN5_CYTMA|nr:hypothetical protein VP1G_11422 [Valsa mali var. pyri (nom. inval.)]